MAAMFAVFLYFVWSTAAAQPWSVGLIAVVLLSSWAVEMFLAPSVPVPAHIKAAPVR
jgi:hypothetical protein